MINKNKKLLNRFLKIQNMIRDSQYVMPEEKEINNIRKKLVNILKYVDTTFYLNEPDTSINIDGKEIQTKEYTLMLLLTYLVNGKAMLKGTFGTGKTSVAGAFTSMFYSLPYDLVENSMVRCNVNLTEEKIFGRLHIGELMLGREKIIWNTFSNVDGSILDEFNRTHPKIQSLFIYLFDDNEVWYLDRCVKKGGPIILTQNEKTSANYDVIEQILDRIDVELYTKPALNIVQYQIENEKEINKRKNRLKSDEGLEQLIRSSIENNSLKEELKHIKEEFRKGKEDIVLSDYENKLLEVKINSIELNDDACEFIDVVYAEANFNPQIGYKNLSPDDKTKNNRINSLFYKIKDKLSLSERWKITIKKYSKALAFLKGDKSVNMSHVRWVMPYTISHILKKPNTNSCMDITKIDEEINMAKNIVNEIYNRCTRSKKIMVNYLKKVSENEKEF